MRGVHIYSMCSIPFLGLCIPVWSYVGLSHNIHTWVLYCACSLAWIRASCLGRVFHPCGAHLCPCSHCKLPCLSGIEAGLPSYTCTGVLSLQSEDSGHSACTCLCVASSIWQILMQSSRLRLEPFDIHCW